MRLAAAILACWLLAAPVRAAEPLSECAPQVELRSAQLRYQSHDGLWFDVEVARCMLIRLKEMEQLELLLGDHIVRGLTQDELIRIIEKQLELSLEETSRSQEALAISIRAQHRAEERATSMRRNPGLWFAVGLITAGTAAALVATLK